MQVLVPGNQSSESTYYSKCPHCGQIIVFSDKEYYEEEFRQYYYCDFCGYEVDGEKYIFKSDTLEAEQLQQEYHKYILDHIVFKNQGEEKWKQ